MSGDAKAVHGTPGKEKKMSDKDLDLTNANRGVWLVKVPKYLADRWESSESPAVLGKLKIARKPGQKPEVSFTLDNNLVNATSTPTAEVIPKEHKFAMSTVMGHTLAVFSHLEGDPDASVPIPDKHALEGKIVQRAECRPIKVYVANVPNFDSLIRLMGLVPVFLQ